MLKSLLADNEPAAVLHRGRESLMRRIESRFRFLAVRPACPKSRLHDVRFNVFSISMRFVHKPVMLGGDGRVQADSAATLRGRRPSYREALLAIRDRLEVQCPGTLATQDLETGPWPTSVQHCAVRKDLSKNALPAAARVL